MRLAKLNNEVELKMSEPKLRVGAQKYTAKDVGCFGDSVFGHEAIRGGLRILLQWGFEADCEVANELRSQLHKPMSDDASEENEALELLNAHAVDGVYFDLVDGDLLLLESENEDG